MTSVLKPEITSIVHGLLTIAVRSASVVGAVFNQVLVFRAAAANGPFTQLVAIGLSGAESYTFLDTTTGPNYYYKAQFYNNSTLVSSVFSELAQETGIFNPYTVPLTTATYPPEIALSEQDREIVESIRLAIGDLGSIEIDRFDSSDPQSAFTCAEHVSPDGCTWELSEPRGWPQKIVLNGVEKISLTDPQVLGYKFLAFSGTMPCITGSLTVWYNHFRFSDHELLLAFDRAANLMNICCPLSSEEITNEMKIVQATILLLEGEIRDIQSSGAVRIRDGDTEYDNSDIIRSRTADLADLRRKLQELLDCARWNNSLSLEGVRID